MESLKKVSLTDYEISVIISSLERLIFDVNLVCSKNYFVRLLSGFGIERVEDIIKKLKEVAYNES